MKEVYQACIKVLPMQKDIYAVPDKSRRNMKNRNEFLYLWNLNRQWVLILPSTFIAEGKNFLKIVLAKAHVETVYGGI